MVKSPINFYIASLTFKNWKVHTVELRSKGPGRKGIPPIREIISDPISYFPIYFYIGYKGISVYGKNWAGPMKSLGAKFRCMLSRWNISSGRYNCNSLRQNITFFRSVQSERLSKPFWAVVSGFLAIYSASGISFLPKLQHHEQNFMVYPNGESRLLE